MGRPLPLRLLARTATETPLRVSSILTESLRGAKGLRRYAIREELRAPDNTIGSFYGLADGELCTRPGFGHTNELRLLNLRRRKESVQTELRNLSTSRESVTGHGRCLSALGHAISTNHVRTLSDQGGLAPAHLLLESQ